MTLLGQIRPHPIYTVVDASGWIVKSVHSWLSQLRLQAGLTFSLSTIEQYGRIMSYLCRWLESQNHDSGLSIDEALLRMNRQDVVNWLGHMASNGAKSPHTLHTRETCLRHFMGWMTTEEAGHLRKSLNSPWGRDGTLRNIARSPNARSPKFISQEIIVQALLGLHNECERCMFHAQYDMGLRIGELVEFCIGDLPDDQMYDPAFEFIPICVNGVKGRGGQRKERITLISRAVLKRIKKYHSTLEYKLAPDWDIADPRKPCFLTVNQLQWSVRNATKQFKSAVRRTPLPDAFRTHWLRHGMAYSVLRSDVGKSYQDRMLMVQQMLGHAGLKTTEIYTQLSPALLTALTKTGRAINRLEEAEFIRAETYLGPLAHQEKRGHRG